jgi:hypothetical protein
MLPVELWKLIVVNNADWTKQRNINRSLRNYTEKEYIQYVKDLPITLYEVVSLDDLDHFFAFNIDETSKKYSIHDCSITDDLKICVSHIRKDVPNMVNKQVETYVTYDGSLDNTVVYRYDCLTSQRVYVSRFERNHINECPILFNASRVLKWINTEDSILVIESLMHYMNKCCNVNSIDKAYLSMVCCASNKTIKEYQRMYAEFFLNHR